MQEGGEYRFTMPQKLAFVNSPPPPSFPKNSALTFEVRVRKIVRGGAAMLQQMRAQQMQQQQQQRTATGAAVTRSPTRAAGSPSRSASRWLRSTSDHLQHREYRIGEQHAEDPEQGAHQQLHGEEHRRCEVDRAPGNVRKHDIALEIMDEEIDDDRPDAVVWARRKADRHHQHSANDCANVGNESEDSGQEAEETGHRNSADREKEPGDQPFEDHSDEAAEQQSTERRSRHARRCGKSQSEPSAAASTRCRDRTALARRRGRCR